MNASVSRAADRVRWARAAAFFPQAVTTALRAAGGFAALENHSAQRGGAASLLLQQMK